MCSEYVRFIIALCCACAILCICVFYLANEIDNLKKSKKFYEDLRSKELSRNEELKKILQGVKDLMPF